MSKDILTIAYSFCFEEGKRPVAVNEGEYKTKLIGKIKSMFPGCFVLKNDANYIQGFPDLTVLCPNGRWALLETKRSSNAHKQPNQPYYIQRGNEMGFARFVCPENEEEVLHDLQQAFRA